MPIKLLFLVTILMGWGALAHAQTPTVDCVPIQGQGWQGCAPTGNNQQSQLPMAPPARWADRWGATAVGTPDSPGFGAAANMPSEHAARESALAKCQAKGSTKCTVQTVYRNQCVALIAGNATTETSKAENLDIASHLAMKRCSDRGDTQCHVFYSACSYPLRIQ